MKKVTTKIQISNEIKNVKPPREKVPVTMGFDNTKVVGFAEVSRKGDKFICEIELDEDIHLSGQQSVSCGYKVFDNDAEMTSLSIL